MPIATRLMLGVPCFGPDQYILLESAFMVRYTHQGRDAVPEYLESKDEQEGVTVRPLGRVGVHMYMRQGD
jgi:hypothetical protein